jgi:hypothetical protein
VTLRESTSPAPGQSLLWLRVRSKTLWGDVKPPTRDPALAMCGKGRRASGPLVTNDICPGSCCDRTVLEMYWHSPDTYHIAVSGDEAKLIVLGPTKSIHTRPALLRAGRWATVRGQDLTTMCRTKGLFDPLWNASRSATTSASLIGGCGNASTTALARSFGRGLVPGDHHQEQKCDHLVVRRPSPSTSAYSNAELLCGHQLADIVREGSAPV